MPGKPWTAEDDARLIEGKAQGIPVNRIALELDRSYHATDMRVKVLRARGRLGVPAPVEVKATADSAMAARLQQLEQQLHDLHVKGQPKRLPVETAAEPSLTPAEAWAQAEADSEKRIREFHERSRFSIDFDAIDPGLPIGVAFCSDQHISPGNTVDHHRMRVDAELIGETPGLYACLGGDGVDNHIAIRSAGLAARSQPHDQWALYNHYLGIFAHKIVALISGNHDAWTDQIAGVDMVKILAGQQKLCYSPAEARITATVGGVPYRLAMRHQYRFNSSFNLLHAVQQWQRNGEEMFDLGVICHHHEPAVGAFRHYGLECWGARPGAYQVGSSYTRQYGWNATGPTCPTFILYPGERQIQGFQDIRLAASFLKHERGGK